MGERFVDTNKVFVIHPDMVGALKDYRNGGIEKALKRRDELKQKGIPYWNTDHDDEMRETAEERSKTVNWMKKQKTEP